MAGAERAARSTIRDRRARSLHRLVRLRGLIFQYHIFNPFLWFVGFRMKVLSFP